MNINLRQNLLTAFTNRFGTPPVFFARAPGRVNLLGEHVDYNDGFVLPAAIDRDTLIAFRKSGTARSTLFAYDLREETTFDQQSVLRKQDSNGLPLSTWARYPAGVLWAIHAAGLDTPGLEAVFASEVPRGAGLSSSASVEMAFGVAWEKLGAWTLLPIQLAQIGLKAETQYVGVTCGIMDQFASACGVKDRLLYLDCRSLVYHTMKLPGEAVIVIADTSVRRSLANSAYNDRHASCEEAVRILKGYMPNIRTLRDVPVDQFRRYAGKLPTTVAKRAQHVVDEIARTNQVINLLEKNDSAGFGKLMNDCHVSLRDLYEVSCPELDMMVTVAQSLPGCYGARLNGAGFGGCTVNLVSRQAVKFFAFDLGNGYAKMTRKQPEVYICHAADGASVEKVK